MASKLLQSRELSPTCMSCFAARQGVSWAYPLAREAIVRFNSEFAQSYPEAASGVVHDGIAAWTPILHDASPQRRKAAVTAPSADDLKCIRTHDGLGTVSPTALRSPGQVFMEMPKKWRAPSPSWETLPFAQVGLWASFPWTGGGRGKDAFAGSSSAGYLPRALLSPSPRRASLFRSRRENSLGNCMEPQAETSSLAQPSPAATPDSAPYPSDRLPFCLRFGRAACDSWCLL